MRCAPCCPGRCEPKPRSHLDPPHEKKLNSGRNNRNYTEPTLNLHPTDLEALSPSPVALIFNYSCQSSSLALCAGTSILSPLASPPIAGRTSGGADGSESTWLDHRKHGTYLGSGTFLHDRLTGLLMPTIASDGGSGWQLQWQ